MPIHPHPIRAPLTPEMRAVFRRALHALNARAIPFSVGGALAVEWYSGIWRVVKDLDLYLIPEQVPPAMETLRDAGFAVAVKHPEWLAQAFWDQLKVELVCGMGNWLAPVDAIWIEAGQEAELLGVPVRVAPVEELIYSKAFLAARERNDAADIYHLVEATGGQLDWQRLLERFGEHWEVLLGHLVVFDYVYPASRHHVPDWLMDELLARLHQTRQHPWLDGKVCRGPLLDGAGSYAIDVEERGYLDARKEAWRRRASSGNFPPLPPREQEREAS